MSSKIKKNSFTFKYIGPDPKPVEVHWLWIRSIIKNV